MSFRIDTKKLKDCLLEPLKKIKQNLKNTLDLNSDALNSLKNEFKPIEKEISKQVRKVEKFYKEKAEPILNDLITSIIELQNELNQEGRQCSMPGDCNNQEESYADL